MFDSNEPETLPEQVKQLFLMLTIQFIVCGIVNAVGMRLAAYYQGSTLATVILLAAFATTGAFLGMNVAAIGGCVLVLRGDEAPEIRPLAKWSLPLTSTVSLLLLTAFFFGSPTGNAFMAGGALAAMLLVMLFPAKWLAKQKK